MSGYYPGGRLVTEDGKLVVGFWKIDQKGIEQEGHGGKGQQYILVPSEYARVSHSRDNQIEGYADGECEP